MWSNADIRKSCQEGDRMFREALMREGHLSWPEAKPAPPMTLSVTMTIPFPEWPEFDISPPTLMTITKRVSQASGFTVEELRGKSRDKKLVEARQRCFWLARKHTGRSYTQIAKFFHRDHTTVLYGVRQWEARHA